MATQPKVTPLATPRLLSDGRRIAQLAEQTELFQAQRWFARERGWINDVHLQLCRVAAPTFFEQPRAEWFQRELSRLGWNATLDRAGNVLASFGTSVHAQPIVVSAHLDTVLAPGRAEDIYYSPDGRLLGPGTADNGSGLTALLALARVLSETPDLFEIASSLLLVANVGEEGEGNLSGMRYLCRHHPQASQFKAFLVLDGPSSEHVTVQGVGQPPIRNQFHRPRRPQLERLRHAEPGSRHQRTSSPLLSGMPMRASWQTAAFAVLTTSALWKAAAASTPYRPARAPS